MVLWVYCKRLRKMLVLSVGLCGIVVLVGWYCGLSDLKADFWLVMDLVGDYYEN